MTGHSPLAALSPPKASVSLWGWAKTHLFSGVWNSLLTVATLYLLWLWVPPLVEWALIKATWVGSTRDDCAPGGACWVFIRQRWSQFFYGFYPEPLRWRVDLAVALAVVWGAPALFARFPWRKAFGFSFLLIYPMLAWWLLYGGDLAGMATVATDQWGGLMLTLVIAAVGIAGAMPLGILLALGRRSSLPVIQAVSIAFIEFWRGVPLISVLFMSSVMLPLFLPEGMNFDKLVRALIAVILFQAAYLAEVVRGGLQAIPKGQYEAAQALGFSYWPMMGLIILPQALKLVIPGIVNTFLALFKDTSLVIIIGLSDFFTMIHRATVDPAWLGFATEGYVFAAAVYWLFCFGMSRYSMALEKRLDTVRRR